MGLRDRVGEVRRSASAAIDGGAGAIRAAKQGAVDLGGGAAAAAKDADGWAREQLGSIPAPVPPLDEPWKLSLGAIISRHPKAPKMTARLLAPLDRFGAIVIGPEGIGFDGDEVAWEQVTRVRTRTAADIAVGAIWDIGVDELRAMLPPVPGRKWAVTKVLQILMSMMIDLEDQVGGAEEEQAPRVACEIVYRGWIRREKTVGAGLFSALALCTMPQVNDALVRCAVERGVSVVPAEPATDITRNERVIALRRRRTALAAQARELEAPDDEP